MTTTVLEDFRVHVKLKLAALWTGVMFLYVYGDIFSMFVPDRLQGLLDGQFGIGETTATKLLLAAILMTIPSMMIFLSVSLPPALNRWLNIIFGVLYTVIIILTTLNSGSPWFVFYRYLGVVEIIATLLIVIHAWRWPRS